MKLIKRYFLLLLAVVSLASCSVSKHLPKDSYLLDKVNVVSSDKSYSSSDAQPNLRQTPNTRVLGLFRWPLRIYCLSGSSDNIVNRVLQKRGEAPRIYSEESTQESVAGIRRDLVNKGYLKANVEAITNTKGRKATVTYFVEPKELYTIRSLRYRGMDTQLVDCVRSDSVHSLLQPGVAFNTSLFSKERTRIVDFLHDKGYYSIQKENVSFIADTARLSTEVDVTINLRQQSHTYMIDSVYYEYSDTPFMRENLLPSHSFIRPGQLYSAKRVRDTYNSYNRFGAVKYTNISFNATSDSTLDCHIVVTPAKRMSTSIELDGTNTAGDLGMSAALSFTNRNLFRGSELMTLKLRGAYETITQLQDYSGDHYIEYGADLGINFPKLILPFVGDETLAHSKATTQLDLQWNSQDRPEFVRRVLSGAWSYLWNVNSYTQHRYDLLGVNFVSVPVKDQYFIDHYLDQYNSRNSIMKFNYEDLFIARTGYTFYHNSQPTILDRSKLFAYYSVRAGIETAGNALSLLSKALGVPKDSLGRYRVGGIAYAQYVKADFALTTNLNINERSALVAHFSAGVAYPYGNARMLPFEKRYYAGGANSVRGWSLRSLGPGSYVTRDGTIDYINQSGDLKLFASLEYRPHLFWKVDGALFVDAGNIWTIYDYDDQPGGQFRQDSFLQQIAVAYGAGVRLNLGFIVVRFDGGMKAINPAYSDDVMHYPIIHPNIKRDFAWHFAVGYPF
ncbi:MAG: BamA/TamA family outer membrane protein [Bacteroidaceae bacterium]|nr:BamA/TamA family outer membrane protein [Bacteroidaceae bacterium]